jgi:hypothetical protein
LRRSIGKRRREPDKFEQLIDPMPGASFPPRQAEDDVVGNRKMRKERAFLRNVSDPPPIRWHMELRPDDPLAADLDNSPVCMLEPTYQPQKGGLATARSTQDRNQRARRNRQGHIAQNYVAAERLCQLYDV